MQDAPTKLIKSMFTIAKFCRNLYHNAGHLKSTVEKGKNVNLNLLLFYTHGTQRTNIINSNNAGTFITYCISNTLGRLELI